MITSIKFSYKSIILGLNMIRKTTIILTFRLLIESYGIKVVSDPVTVTVI